VAADWNHLCHSGAGDLCGSGALKPAILFDLLALQ
jgi:hypothetical protein